VFQQQEENERLLVFRQREKLLRMVLQQRKGGKSETSAGRSCFGSENDGGMGCFCDWEEIKSTEQRCFGVGGTVTSVLQRCFSIGEMNNVARRCFSIMKNHQCCTMVFQQRESLFSLKIGLSCALILQTSTVGRYFFDRDY
jgi:hypothetical protein